jgi:hypothetical protein
MSRGDGEQQQNACHGKKRHFKITCSGCRQATAVFAALLCCLGAAQGRFKRPVPAANLCMGQEFVKPGQAPAWVGDLIFNAAAKVFSNSTQVWRSHMPHSSSL